MTSTDLERRHDENVSLFPGTTADAILTAAADVATKFSDVVKTQRMSKRIGDNDHIQIEAWQTIGALTGVLADEGVVTQLVWPDIEPLGDEPPIPGREPRRDKDTPEYREWKNADDARNAWELHRDMLRARGMGRAYGFTAAFRASKNGSGVGWGEGRCTRGEASKVRQDDYALSSMAQTRGQSRALGAPLKFVVKLAGYETTPAEELDGAEPAASTGAAAPAAPWGPVTEADDDLKKAAAAVKAIAGDTPVEAEQFILLMGQHFNGLPVAGATMLRGLARFLSDARALTPAPENAPPPADQSAYHHPGPDPNVVYPPGHYQGD